MKKIFRSIIDIPKDGRPTIEQEDLIRNYRSFMASNIDPEEASYIKLFSWIEAHYRDHKEVPSVQLLAQRAEKDGDEGVLASIKDIVTEIPFIRSNYNEILKQKFEEQSKSNLSKVIQQTWEAANNGIETGVGKFKKKIVGISSAIEYFINESRKFRMGNFSVKTDSNINTEEDAKEVIEAYRKKKANPITNLGLYSFLDRIDDTCKGLKPGEMMLIAAYVKQGKTILTTNLAYNAIMQGLNGIFISLEMNHNEMRDMFYVLHCCNPEWLDHPKYKNLVGKVTYDKVTYGELSDTEQEFFEAASKDFPARKDFGTLSLVQPTEALTPSNLERLAYDCNTRLKEQGKTLDFLVVDYVGRMIVDKSEKYGDFNIDLNRIITRLKELALTFDNGRMLRIISPFQVNRSGFKEAEKNDGIYGLAALSNANEAERSSDLIISTYMDKDQKKAGIIKIGCMAHRKGADFDAFEAHIDFGTRQIRDFIQKSKIPGGNDMGVNNIPLDI